MKKILFFYGNGCPDCTRVSPWMKRLEAEEIVTFERLGVWNEPENEARKQQYDDLFIQAYGRATIVPAFVDPNQQRVLCDPKTPEELKEWIQG